MRECENLIHPFQHNPGVSQRQRVMEDLHSGSANIDGRTLADLLDYFMQLSRHIQFYEEDLSVSDWQPFFKKSLPFTVAAITKFDSDSINQKLAFYHQLFRKNPSSSGLQLLVHFLYYRLINPLNIWQMQTQKSELPVAFALEKLIKNKLQRTVKEFVRHTNAAVKWYCIKPVDWQLLHQNEVWNLYTSDLHEFDESFKDNGTTRSDRIIALYDTILRLSPAFLDVMRLVANAASSSMDQSLIPLKDELREKHQPHLALLFSFLKLFRYLQDDLNRFTKKHLDFFYKQVLQLEPREAVPDKAHIVFEIQKQLDSYLLKKGLQVKDGKDDNKAEVLFALDDEIVVNKTQVADKRTLFLNNQSMSDVSYVEGVYMAPDAGKADGIDKDFKDNGLKSFPTLGAKNSKYTDPEHGFIKPYPNARLGFILASPVLLLNEGKRTITINLACELRQNICDEIKVSAGASSSCCEDNGEESESFIQYPTFAPSAEFYEQIAPLINQTYYYVSQNLIVQAQKKGINGDIANKLKNFLTSEKKICYCETDITVNDVIVPATKTDGSGFEDVFIEGEREILAEFFKPQKAIKILFSGEREWLFPNTPADITLTPSPLPDSRKFMLTITATFETDKPAITFYDEEQLKEDFNTTLPLVKIELEDKIKLERLIVPDPGECCLGIDTEEDSLYVSLYHFFRNVKIINKIGNNPDQTDDETGIGVTVCELKNFIVQNDESVQDVNAPVYPFGTRPAIADFDIVNPADPPLANPNLIGPNFYIGSNEVFCKKWNNVRININWKDKPSDFREHYNAYVVEDVATQTFGLDQDEFKIRLSLLQNKNWQTEATDRKLFDISPPDELPPAGPDLCDYGDKYEQSISLNAEDFQDLGFCIDPAGTKPLDVNTSDSFIKINLKNQDFLHKDYAFVLARQMMALGRYPDAILEGAVYKKEGDTVIVFRSLGKTIVELKDEIIDTKDLVKLVKDKIDDLNSTYDAAIDFPPPLSSINNAERDSLTPLVHDSKTLSDNANQQAIDTKEKLDDLQSIIDIFDVISGEIVKPLTVLIPKEPWTPIIKEMSIDYTARASITDIDLIHLYPYEGTYKPEELESQPTLLPTFCDEGTLFLGLKDLVPGSNVNILFQLAEATADSESMREDLHWYYLDNNQWKLLREGFEVLEDETDGLTASGIIKFAPPANMTSDNTILPKGLHWIKAAIPRNSRSVSKTIGIHTQAVRVTFTNEESNDKMRLADALPAGSIAKLKEADAFVKKVNQPYDGFGGRRPEASGHYYVRTSELLRHKGRSIQKFDYERLALEAFPKLFKVKCINHSFGLNAHKYFNDFPVAPGYVLLAVIPDLNKLKAAASFEPRAPVSLLGKIKDYLRERTSPFVRLKIMNPRYEKVHFCLKVKLYLGRDENFYKEKLRQDLREFLAPWAVGQYEKITFGQCIYRSDIVRFLESRDYLDYVLELGMSHEREPGSPDPNALKICPLTPRSILIAGDIDVCINQQDCETWDKCYEHDREVDCCDHKKIAVVDYCKEPEIN